MGTFTCTAAEKTQLATVSVSVSVSISMVTAEVSHIQETLQSVTGSQASDDEMEAANICESDDDCDSLVDFPDETTVAPTPVPAPAPVPSPSPVPSPAPV